MLESMWESGLDWRPRSPNKILDLWANFGPLRAKISQIAWGTPTFYCTPRLYLPIGIQKYTYFCWCIFFHFWLGSKSQWRPVLCMFTYSFQYLLYLCCIANTKKTIKVVQERSYTFIIFMSSEMATLQTWPPP